MLSNFFSFFYLAYYKSNNYCPFMLISATFAEIFKPTQERRVHFKVFFLNMIFYLFFFVVFFFYFHNNVFAFRLLFAAVVVLVVFAYKCLWGIYST